LVIGVVKRRFSLFCIDAGEHGPSGYDTKGLKNEQKCSEYLRPLSNPYKNLQSVEFFLWKANELDLDAIEIRGLS